MDPVSIVAELAGRGIAVEALPDGRLKITPAGALTDGDRERIARAKPAIMAHLTGQPAWSPTGRSWFCPCGASVSAAGWAAGLCCPFCGAAPPDGDGRGKRHETMSQLWNEVSHGRTI